MSTGLANVGFPVPGWFRSFNFGEEYIRRIDGYAAFCRAHASDIAFTHDLWVKGNGSGGMGGVASAYFVGQAAFLEATMPDKAPKFLHGCFWLGDRSQIFYNDVPMDLLVVPTISTLKKKVDNLLAGAGYMVVERSFSTGEYPDNERTVWVMEDTQNDRLLIQAAYEEEADEAVSSADDEEGENTEVENPFELLFLNNNLLLLFDGDANLYFMTRMGLAGQLLEESFPAP